MNILLTSVGRRSYMVRYFKEAINGKGEIHVANSKHLSPALDVADKFVITPLIYSEQYVPFLIDYAITNKIDAIISLFDIDLPILAKNKYKFEEAGIKLIVSDYELVKVCNDKWLSYSYLKKNGFFVPATYLSLVEVKEGLNDGEIKFPVIIKPRWGMGSIGIFQADNLLELEVLYNKSKNKIFDSYLKFESKAAVNESIIIQEKLEGDEYGIDIFNDLEGNLLTCVPKIKLGMRAGETDCAKILDEPQLVNLGKQIAETTKHIGNMDLDCFFMNGDFYILEMNCRFGGQYPFSHLAGVNFPKAIINMLMGKSVEPDLLNFQKEIVGVKDLTPLILKN